MDFVACTKSKDQKWQCILKCTYVTFKLKKSSWYAISLHVSPYFANKNLQKFYSNFQIIIIAKKTTEYTYSCTLAHVIVSCDLTF